MSKSMTVSLKIPDNVNATAVGSVFKVSANGNTCGHDVGDSVSISINGSTLAIAPKDEAKNVKALIGLHRSYLRNAIIGVLDGFSISLELIGVGFKVSVKNDMMMFFLGYSHFIYYIMPEGITAEATSNTLLVIKGVSKQAVGQVAADIIALRRTEPYKGSGIKIKGQKILRKEGKRK